MSRRPTTGSALALSMCLTMATGCGAGGGDAPAQEGTATEAALPTEGVFGQAPLPARGVPSVITLMALGPVEVASAPAPTIDQLGLQFAPRRLLVPIGEPVRFRNSEAIAHNVNIRSIETEATLFNADSPPDESLTFVFEEGGGYDILCDTHPGMSAFVFATLATYAAITDDDGAFQIVDVLPGEYTLRVWSADPDRRSEQRIVVRAGAATEVSMTPLD